VPRVKTGVTARRRHRKVLEQTKGQYNTKHRLYRRANEALLHSLRYQTRDRKRRKRDMRRLWVTRINAAARQNDMSYSCFMHGLKLSEIDINRKMLADMAVRDPESFATLVGMAKEARESLTA